MAFDPKIGLRLRKHRRKAGLSLRELARRAELTASFLSQVERGQTNISLDSLRRLGEALNVSFLYFLSDENGAAEKPTTPVSTSKASAFDFSEETGKAQDNDEAIDKDDDETSSSGKLRYCPVVRADERPRIIFPDTGVSYELLVPSLSYKMEVIQGRISKGTANVVRPLREPTEEFIYVLSGALLVGLDSGDYVLEAGDTIYFNGSSLKTLAAASEEEAVWVSVITPPVF